MASSRVFVRTESGSVLWGSEPAAPGLRERAPRARLRPYVEALQLCREELPSPVEERVLPDGAVHLFFDLGERPAASAVGASEGPTLLRLAGSIDQVGVRLRPGAIASVAGAPASELGTGVPLEALWGREATRVLERLAALPREARLAAIEEVLERRLADVDAVPDRRAAAAAAQVLLRRGTVRVSELASLTGLTERRLEQLFAAQVGASPRVFARITRFRHAAARLAAGARGADVAQACGYHDQAHLIREFRALAGVPPGALADFGSVQSRAGGES